MDFSLDFLKAKCGIIIEKIESRSDPIPNPYIIKNEIYPKLSLYRNLVPFFLNLRHFI